MKDIAKPSKNKGIAKDQALWLLNLDNGRIFPWTTLLAVRRGFVDCTADGVPINPKDVPGDHPWIKQQTQGLADRMWDAGANPDTMQDFGRQLTDDAAAKFKSLDYDKAVQLGIGQDKLENMRAEWVGATVRIQNKIDKHVLRVKNEIFEMSVEALMSLGFTNYQACMRLRKS